MTVRQVNSPGSVILSSNVLFVASEAVLLAKTGGLEDMVGAYTGVPRHADMKVTMMLPSYPDVIAQLQHTRMMCERAGLSGGPAHLLSGHTGAQGIPVLSLDTPTLFMRPDNPCLDTHGESYEDNALRFVAFNQAAAHVAAGMPDVHRVDTVQVYDWHVGLVPLFVEWVQVPVKTVSTIYGLAFQSNFPTRVVRDTGIPPNAAHGAEFWGQFSFLKAGLLWAGRITAVSHVYTREILTDAVGCGVQGLLRMRRQDLAAILSSIDNDVWDPSKGPLLLQPSVVSSLSGKHTAKCVLQQRFGLPEDAEASLLALGSRLTH